MGRRNKRKLKHLLLFITLLFCQNNYFSQTKTKISGIVNNNEKLFSVSIILKDSINNSFLDYTYSTDEGNYSLSTLKKGKFNLTFSSLGYRTKNVSFAITNQTEIKIDAQLKEKPFELNEIIIEADKVQQIVDFY